MAKDAIVTKITQKQNVHSVWSQRKELDFARMQNWKMSITSRNVFGISAQLLPIVDCKEMLSLNLKVTTEMCRT